VSGWDFTILKGSLAHLTCLSTYIGHDHGSTEFAYKRRLGLHKAKPIC